MRYTLVVYNTCELSATEVKKNGIVYVLKAVILDAYLNRILANNYVLSLKAFEYDEPTFSYRDSSKYDVAFKAELECERFYPGRVLLNCRLDTDSGKLLKAMYKLPDGYEIPIIVTAKDTSGIVVEEYSTPLVITTIASRAISGTLRCVAEILTPVVALDFVNYFNYPHTLSHYNTHPERVEYTTFMTNPVLPSAAIAGGAKKTDSVSSFYYQFGTPLARKQELYHHIVSRIIGPTVSIEPPSEAKAFTGFLRRTKNKIKVVTDSPQTVIFTTAQKAMKDVGGMSGVDFAVIDSPIDAIPKELTFIDIYKPICSAEYFTIVTTDGFPQSRDYCLELLELDRQRRELIDLAFSGQSIPKNLAKTATLMYTTTFK